MLACEKDSTSLNEDVLPVFDPLDCLQRDCATGTNSLVLLTSSTTKSGVPLSGIQRAYREQYSVEEHLARLQSDGYPAWGALLTVDVNEEYKHYLVPVYKSTSNRVDAVVSVIHYLGHGMARIDYLDRDDIDNHISYYDSELASKSQQELGDRKFTKEALSYIHLSLDYELFGYYDTDALNNISPGATQDFFAKDCKITVHYISETVWYTSAGGQVIDVSSTYTFTSETIISDGVGCGGGTPPGGPGGSPGTGGGGPTTGNNGPGTVIINRNPNDPNNRCIEDGVGCDEEEEDFVVSLLEDSPGDKPLDVFDDKCNGLSGLWNRSNGPGNPEVFGVLTRGGNFLVTQAVGTIGGQVNGLYSQTDAVTNEETTYYFYPTSAGAISLPGDNVVNNGTYYFIPISATVHSHSPCISDGTDGISNRTVEDDQSLALSFPGVRHYILGCGAIGQFSHVSATPFNIQHGGLSSLCSSFN